MGERSAQLTNEDWKWPSAEESSDVGQGPTPDSYPERRYTFLYLYWQRAGRLFVIYNPGKMVRIRKRSLEVS